MEHLGEAVFRDDLDNSILELGDLLTHEGPALRRKRRPPRSSAPSEPISSSTARRPPTRLLGALIAEGDLVLFDRNNHKAAHHGALFLTGGIPIYLPTERNAYGLIGPIRRRRLDETAIREASGPTRWSRIPRPGGANGHSAPR